MAISIRVWVMKASINTDTKKNVRCAFDKMVDLDALIPHPRNPNKHPKQQIELLAKIMKVQGVRSPIVLSKRSGFITKGHGRLAAAQLNEWADFPVDMQEYDSEAKEYADMVADNKIAELAASDMDMITEDARKFKDTLDFDLLGIPDFKLPEDEAAENEKADSIPTDVETRCKLGDLWELGEHRLLCGDCTDTKLVDRLMQGDKADMVFTDPPYGMDLDTNHDELFKNDSTHVIKGDRFKKVIGDDEEYDPTPCLRFDCQKFLWGFDWYYQNLPSGGSVIAWDKRDESLDKVPGNTSEFCWAMPPVRRMSARIKWSGHHGMQPDDTKKRVHPTQKPTALAEWFFERWGKKTRLVWDGYLGSGSTLIACEKTNRKCYGMEIDPHYCDVILKRWEDYTQKKATLGS